MSGDLLRILTLQDANVRYVLLGATLIGATGGLLGIFAVLRKRSLVGDAMAHAALPGICIAFLLTGSKSILPLLAGAAVSGVIGVLAIQSIVNHTRIKPDAAIGIVLSVFFGIGIVLLTFIQRSPAGNQSGLDKFLFGQAASMVSSDIKVMAVLAVFIIVVVVLLFKELKCLIFDKDFLAISGFPAKAVDLILMGLIVLTVMVGLQAVGLILIAAMLITPAAAARYWSDNLNRVLVLSVVFGALSGIVGTIVSSLAPRIPTGPVMVVCATGIFALSSTFAPERGILARWRRVLSNRRRESIQHFLRAFIELGEQFPGRNAFSPEEIAGKLDLTVAQTGAVFNRVKAEKLGYRRNGEVFLTDKGHEEGVFVVKSHRLWEYYLVYRSDLKLDHTHRPAHEAEHILTPEIIEKLEEILAKAGVETTKMSEIHEEADSSLRGGGDE